MSSAGEIPSQHLILSPSCHLDANQRLSQLGSICMKSRVGHLQFNIDSANHGFYAELLGFLGWKVQYLEEGYAEFKNELGTSVDFASGANGHVNHHDGQGLSHLGFNVDTKS